MPAASQALAPLSFRVAGGDDADAIVALVNSAYRGESSRAGWTTEADFLDGQRTDVEEVAQLVAAKDSAILLCHAGDALIGSVHLEKQSDAAWLGMLVVKPVLQGRGIGKRFMEAAERYARDTWGTARMRMTVIRFRDELIAYYERRGYRRTGERRPFPTDPRYGIRKVEGLEFEVLEKRLR